MRYEQQPPPQQPPPDGAAGIDCAEPPPTDANTLNIRTALSWPCGHVAGAFASAIGRRSSNVESHVRQRNSYKGMYQVYGTSFT